MRMRQEGGYTDSRLARSLDLGSRLSRVRQFRSISTLFLELLSASPFGFLVAPPLSAGEPVLDAASVAPTASAATAAAVLLAASVAAPSALSSPFATTAASLT